MVPRRIRRLPRRIEPVSETIKARLRRRYPDPTEYAKHVSRLSVKAGIAAIQDHEPLFVLKPEKRETLAKILDSSEIRRHLAHPHSPEGRALSIVIRRLLEQEKEHSVTATQRIMLFLKVFGVHYMHLMK